MIQRFCFAKLLDDDVPHRSAVAAQLRASLAAAGAEAVVGLPADDSAARWDLSILITIGSLEAWRDLAEHPAVRAAFDELAARAAVVKAWTFEA